MATSIPYGNETYELTGIEYCELEDLLEAIPADDTVAYEQVVYAFLCEHGYEVEPPEIQGINLGGVRLESDLGRERQGKQIKSAADALHTRTIAAQARQTSGNFPQRKRETSWRDDEVVAQLMARAKKLPPVQDKKEWTHYLFWAIIIFTVCGAILNSRAVRLNRPPMQYLHKKENTETTETTEEKGTDAPASKKADTHTTSPKKSVPTGTAAQESPKQPEAVTPLSTPLPVYPPSESVPPLPQPEHPAPVRRGGQPKKVQDMRELLRDVKPSDAY